ncbi:MAG: peptide-methionine (S)-S-oxide reductase MsrA [Xanthomonadaceae bacterium]|nr:peptide-methionine (S)-S-oxide reductase MsrA [Xanthomonadaceae bacterium]
MKTNTLRVISMVLLSFFATEAQNSWAKSKKTSHKGKTKMSETQTIVLGGGCFWGVEDLIRKQDGVVKTLVGYTGGNEADAKYERVKKGNTGHVETVLVEYDPKKLKLEELLKFFFKLHNPTTLNQQGNDIGSQYRSVIFVSSQDQREVSERVIKLVNESKQWKSPVVTAIEELKNFFPAEDYHQDYLIKNPDGYTCHWVRKITF